MGIAQDKTAQDKTAQDKRVQELKEYYKLEEHPEGGWFAECYTSEAAAHENAGNPEADAGQKLPNQPSAPSRSYAGSIYFLLDKADISHFHRIDCEEVWYFHEGCGLKITTIDEKGRVDQILLGSSMAKGESVMAVIPKGVIFASQNLDSEGYSFVSCMTAPKFSYEGFELIGKGELKRLFPKITEDVLTLAYEEKELSKV